MKLGKRKKNVIIIFLDKMIGFLHSPPRKPNMDLTKIDNVVVEGVNLTDLPDLVDSFIASADYNGVEMTEKQLDEINEDYDFVHEQDLNSLY